MKASIIAFLYLCLLIGCASKEQNRDLNTNQVTPVSNKDVVIQYWNLLDWSHLSKDKYIITKDTPIRGTWERLGYNLLSYDLKTPTEPQNFVFSEREVTLLDLKVFERIQKRISENYSGLDPFDVERFKKEDIELFKSDIYRLIAVPFNIKNYDINKQTYSIKIGQNSPTGEDNLYDLFSVDFKIDYCPDEIKILDFFLPKEIAEEVRLKRGRIYLHSKVMKMKTFSNTITECSNSNQFAKDGCLEWKKVKKTYHISPLKIESLEIISGDQIIFDAFMQDFKLTLDAKNTYRHKLKTPVVFECK